LLLRMLSIGIKVPGISRVKAVFLVFPCFPFLSRRFGDPERLKIICLWLSNEKKDGTIFFFFRKVTE
jgi:hypothetical protein